MATNSIINYQELWDRIKEYAFKVGRVAVRPVLLLYYVMRSEDNIVVRDNLKWLAENGHANKATIRTPLIPNYNSQSDIDYSIAELKAMGYSKFESLTYTTEKVTNKDIMLLAK